MNWLYTTLASAALALALGGCNKKEEPDMLPYVRMEVGKVDTVVPVKRTYNEYHVCRKFSLAVRANDVEGSNRGIDRVVILEVGKNKRPLELTNADNRDKLFFRGGVTVEDLSSPDKAKTTAYVAEVKDNGGNVVYSNTIKVEFDPRLCPKDTTPPKVSLKSRYGPKTGMLALIDCDVADDTGLSRIVFYVDSELKREYRPIRPALTFVTNDSYNSPGKHHYKLVACDRSNNCSQEELEIEFSGAINLR